ncbi:MAG: family 43 glycosylhydrolase [Clostridiaceae bacterium]|nr:family 43 glycosylhydrolase [Clostridiaceae bacterium]
MRRKLLPIILIMSMLMSLFPGAGIISASAESTEYIIDDMVAWYKFDEGRGTIAYDASGRGNHARLVNGAGWSTGKLMGAVSLNGNQQYVELPKGIVKDLNNFTIATWIYVNATQDWARVFDFGNDTTSYMFMTPRAGSSPRFRYAIRTATSGGETMVVRNTAVNLESWRHVAITLSGNTATLYYDGDIAGIQVAMNIKPSDLGVTLNNWIGRSQFSADPYLNGMVDDFRIYNRALSEAEIKALFTMEQPKAEEVLPVDVVAYTTRTPKMPDVVNVKFADGLTSVVGVTWDEIDPQKYAEPGSFTVEGTVEYLGLKAVANVTVVPWKVESVEPVNVETYMGIQPVLPDTVTLIYNDGTTETASVAWDEIDPKNLEEKGTFTLYGTVEGIDIKAKAYITVHSQADKVFEDAQELRVYHIDDVRGNLYLPTKGKNGSVITWESEDPSIITPTGEVTRPANGSGDVSVKLTATLTLQGATITKPFLATVREMPAQEEKAGYLLTYMLGEGYANGEQVYFALSNGNNPLRYNELNNGNPVLTSNLGEKGVRDAYIIRSPEGDKFYLVATDLKIYGNNDWTRASTNGSRYISIWESTDLVNWSEQRLALVSSELAGNTWAPEIFYDHDTGEYMIFWASRMFSTPQKTDNPHQRIMYTKTRDFYNFTPAQEYFNPGYSVIDTTIIEHNGKYYRFTKDERSRSTSAPDGKRVFQDVGDSLFGQFRTIVTGIGKETISQGEGPLIFKSNTEDKWYLFIDNYGGIGYVPFVTTDLDSGQWTAVPQGEYRLTSQRPRHGTVLPLTASEYARLSTTVPTVVPDPGPEVTGVTLDKDKVVLRKGEQYQLTAEVVPATAKNKTVLWSSNDKSVATVSDTGLITAKDTGTAVITATTVDGWVIAKCEVTVEKISYYTIQTSFNMTELEAENLLEANVKVTNSGDTEDSVLCIVALYDENNRMVNVSYIAKDIPIGSTEDLWGGFKLPSDVTGHVAKAFVWDGDSLDTTKMQPLSEVVSIP